MGKPYVPYTAKRIITACLEHNWDFELSHGPATLFLKVDGMEHSIRCEFRKTPGVDAMQRPTTKYETVCIGYNGAEKMPFGMSVDSACMLIESNTII